MCAIYHTSAVNTCKLKDKHPELLGDIPILQHQLKELGQKFVKAKSDHDVFATSSQQAKPMIISGIVLASSGFRNNGTKKPFTTDILNLANQN